MSREICEFELKLHGTTTSDPKLKHGSAAIFEGVTSSHSGGVIRFTDQKLFDEFIELKTGIPYTIVEEKDQKVFQIEVNFGPVGAVGLQEENATLYSELEARLFNMLLSPVELSEKGKQLLCCHSPSST